MKLVSFSVKNFRSITAAYKIPVLDFVVFIGPNNEGKSNLLQAIVTAFDVLSMYAREQIVQRGRRSFGLRERYVWERDFPISLQEENPNGTSEFRLEFELTDDEVGQFSDDVGSSLNGTLPISVVVGRDRGAVRVVKRGPGGTILNRKTDAIAAFVAKRVGFQHIPAVRTARSAVSVVEELVAQELRIVEGNASYKEALAAVAKLQDPILERLSERITSTLSSFLPAVTRVELRIAKEERYTALRHAVQVIVDDGTPTVLERKGDGVQSLAALGMLRGLDDSPDRHLIVAIEEPESHLHPEAIHRLRGVIQELAAKYQVVVATHSPIFVERSRPEANIIVMGGRATPAKNIAAVRQVLGVKASDNLLHAELVLLVEGECDRIAIGALLAARSATAAAALQANRLVIRELGGVTKLSQALASLREAVCAGHCFLDNDNEAKNGIRDARTAGLLDPLDVHQAICLGRRESELEDLYDVGMYRDWVKSDWGVDLATPRFSGKKKWSSRMAEVFAMTGKTWDDESGRTIKGEIARRVAASAGTAIAPQRGGCIDALVRALEAKLTGEHSEPQPPIPDNDAPQAGVMILE